MPTAHSAVVHFPLVLLLVAAIFQLIAVFRPRKGLPMASCRFITWGIYRCLCSRFICPPSYTRIESVSSTRSGTSRAIGKLHRLVFGHGTAIESGNFFTIMSLAGSIDRVDIDWFSLFCHACKSYGRGASVSVWSWPPWGVSGTT